MCEKEKEENCVFDRLVPGNSSFFFLFSSAKAPDTRIALELKKKKKDDERIIIEPPFTDSAPMNSSFSIRCDIVAFIETKRTSNM